MSSKVNRGAHEKLVAKDLADGLCAALREAEALLETIPEGVWSWERNYRAQDERQDSWTLYVDRGEPITDELPRGHLCNQQHGYNILGGADFDVNGEDLRAFILAAPRVLRTILTSLRPSSRAEAERTPEVVLRAMLKAYEAAALAAHVGHFRSESNTPTERELYDRARLLNRQCEVIRRELAGVLAGFEDPVDFEVSGERTARSDDLMADYEARLRGERPLDAPPLGMPGE